MGKLRSIIVIFKISPGYIITVLVLFPFIIKIPSANAERKLELAVFILRISPLIDENDLIIIKVAQSIDMIVLIVA